MIGELKKAQDCQTFGVYIKEQRQAAGPETLSWKNLGRYYRI